MIIENSKRIMSEKKITLLLLRNLDCKKVKAETEKINVYIYLNEKKNYGIKPINPLKNSNRNWKPGWEIRLETNIRNLWQQPKKDYKEEGPWNMLQRKRNINSTRKTNNTTRGDKPEVRGQRRKMKRYRDKIKHYRQNRTIPNNNKRSGNRDECINTYQRLDDKETKQFWRKFWERREQKRKAEWIRNMGKELEGL